MFQRDWNHQPVFCFFAQSDVDSPNRVEILVSEVLLRWLVLKFFGLDVGNYKYLIYR